MEDVYPLAHLDFVWSAALSPQEECRKYGELRQVIIPRPTAEQPHPIGLGKVIIEYGDIQAAVKARNAMHGRKFGGHVVAATYLQEEDLATGEYNKSA